MSDKLDQFDSIANTLMRGYGNPPSQTATGMRLLQEQQDAAMRNMLTQTMVTANPPMMYPRPDEMRFVLKEISNGYTVHVGGEEVYVKCLNDVGSVIVAQWAAKQLEK